MQRAAHSNAENAGSAENGRRLGRKGEAKRGPSKLGKKRQTSVLG